ncbi:type VI secretion system baseplate subunit TssK [Haloferula sp. BvORR071]|uniref:type VI secretion system baseplate subunit TssK n=1 Tax=Haloferula sp. BvORR071 TaxID=1396141 RepID=UPI000551AE56|nr:type VI secretion system baseplate subunit TssK [Haloferula sp. BvORR071]
MSDYIHWREGLFLQPHHLQQFQRGVHHRIEQVARLGGSFPHGVIDMDLAEDDLENFQVRFRKLHVLLPSGTLLRFPEEADLPVLNIKEAFSSGKETLLIHLALPLWFEERPNVAEDNTGAAAVRYTLARRETNDENTGQHPQVLELRRLNARLLLDGPDLRRLDYELLPVLRITRTERQNLPDIPRRDPAFVPGALSLAGMPGVRELVRDLGSRITAVRREFSALLVDNPPLGESFGPESLRYLFRLRILSRFEATIPAIVEAGEVPPFDLYLHLRELLGEFAALEPEQEDFASSAYDHSNAYPAFAELVTRIRKYLTGPKQRYRSVDFVKEDRRFTAPVSAELFHEAASFYLAVRSAWPASDLVTLAEDSSQFQLLPGEVARDKVAVRGIKMKEVRNLPFGLPRDPGLYYFRILAEESRELWERLTNDDSACIQFSGAASSDFKIAFIIPIPTRTS